MHLIVLFLSLCNCDHDVNVRDDGRNMALATRPYLRNQSQASDVHHDTWLVKVSVAGLCRPDCGAKIEAASLPWAWAR